MKKRYILIEFLLVLAFLAVPPVFVSHGTGLSQAGTFNASVLYQLLISVILFFQFLKLKTAEKSKTKIFRFLFHGTITLGILMIIFALMQSIELLFSNEEMKSQNFMPDVDGPLSILFLTLAVVCGAFYEEVLYRQFLPEFMALIAGEKINRKLVFYGTEFLALLLFAFAHRYQGWISVVNSFLCGTVLRLCYKKTSSVLPGAAAHAVYNLSLSVFYILIFCQTN